MTEKANPGFEPGYSTHAKIASVQPAPAEMPGEEREIEAWRRSSSDTWQAMVAMRNSINEHLPMPSLEGDLRDGPSNGVFCEAVARAVVGKVTQLEAECREMAMQALADDQQLTEALDRALAAEAALAAAVEALAPFADEKNGAMQDILWGDQPDSATMTITCPLGQVRKAREVVRAAAIRAHRE